MKRSNQIRLATMALLIALVSYMSGCSVVGFWGGAAIDSKRPDYTMVEGDEVISMKQGTKMRLHLTDDSYINGEITGYSSKVPKELAPVDLDSSLTIDQRMLIFESSFYSDSARQTQYIPMQSVSFAEIRDTKNAKYIGLGIGLLLDITAIMSMHFNLDFRPAIADAFSEAGR